MEAAQKYHTTRCCNGAAACRCLFSLLTVDGRFEGHPPFTEPCIITLRDSKGRPIRPPVETTQRLVEIGGVEIVERLVEEGMFGRLVEGCIL